MKRLIKTPLNIALDLDELTAVRIIAYRCDCWCVQVWLRNSQTFIVGDYRSESAAREYYDVLVDRWLVADDD